MSGHPASCLCPACLMRRRERLALEAMPRRVFVRCYAIQARTANRRACGRNVLMDQAQALEELAGPCPDCGSEAGPPIRVEVAP